MKNIKLETPKLKPITVNKAPALSGNLQRNYWAAAMLLTGQITVSDTGEVKKTRKRITEQQSDIAWYLLSVPFHVARKRYARRTGITPTGVVHVNEDKKLHVSKDLVDTFLKRITAKKAAGYTARIFS